MENEGATSKELREILGEKRERLGIFDGDLKEGILEAGQGVQKIDEILSVKEVFDRLIV